MKVLLRAKLVDKVTANPSPFYDTEDEKLLDNNHEMIKMDAQVVATMHKKLALK